jgi:ornithine cyclodeaminase/alanine dehydrogenase-like protein (mu-crystallin family)
MESTVRDKNQTLIFSVDDIRRIVRQIGVNQLMDEVIARLTHACDTYDAAKACAPARSGFEYQLPGIGLLEWMPVIEFGRRALIKVVGYHPANPSRRTLPTILSTALTYDVETGHMLALMDGTFMTALRTGAASAVATRLLAPRQSRVLGLVGAGAQAIAQLHGLSRVLELERVLVFDTDARVSASFAERAGLLGLENIDIRVAPLETVVTTAHVLCTATSVDIGAGPVFEDSPLLHAGLHINAVGSDFPGKVEVPKSVLRRSLVCPDFLEQALREGECQQLQPGDVGPDLVTLVKRAKELEDYRDRPTVFDSTGWAFEDLVAADVLLSHGRDLGCGTKVVIESMAADPRNPYAFACDAASTDISDGSVGMILRSR